MLQTEKFTLALIVSGFIVFIRFILRIFSVIFSKYLRFV